MLLHLSIAIFPFVANPILASPASSDTLEPRDASNAPLPGTPGIASTVISSNGTDISSNFKTLFYVPEDVDATNLTERDISTRQTITGPGTRAINSCRSLQARFLLSMCDYHAGHTTSMQRYLVQCSVPNRRTNPTGSRVITEWGACNRDEICLNGARDQNGLPTMAFCVGQRRFQHIPNYDTPEGQQHLHDYLANRLATAVMSHPDSWTPMKLESLELDAGVAGSSKEGGKVGPTSQQKCEDCFELSTKKLTNGENFLSTEAKVVGGVSAGVAGILWMAALSG